MSQPRRARFERWARSMSLHRAATLAGISVRDVADIEDDRRPEPVALRALARVYGYSDAEAHLLLREVPVHEAPAPLPPDMDAKLAEFREAAEQRRAEARRRR